MLISPSRGHQDKFGFFVVVRFLTRERLAIIGNRAQYRVKIGFNPRPIDRQTPIALRLDEGLNRLDKLSSFIAVIGKGPLDDGEDFLTLVLGRRPRAIGLLPYPPADRAIANRAYPV